MPYEFTDRAPYPRERRSALNGARKRDEVEAMIGLLRRANSSSPLRRIAARYAIKCKLMRYRPKTRLKLLRLVKEKGV